MKKYKLIVPDITGENDNIVKGFKAAEERAKELFAEYIENYPDCYVACIEEDRSLIDDDFLMYQRDCFGDCCWKMMVMGTLVPLYSRLLEEREEEELEEWRNEVERHVSELNEEELKQLRSEVCVGSLYFSDYANSFGIDEKEVLDVCDAYDEYLSTDGDGETLPESEWKADTREEFAYYCLNNLY